MRNAEQFVMALKEKKKKKKLCALQIQFIYQAIKKG